MERGVNPAVPVEPEALQRESLSFGVTRHIPGPVEDRNRGNDIPFRKLPVRGFPRELFGIDFDLAARGLQRVLHRVLPERFKRDRVLAVTPDLRHAVLPEGREVGELRHLLTRFLVAPLHPVHLRAAFGELLLKPQLRGEKPADLEGRFLVIHRLHGFLDREHAGHVAVRAALARRVVRFRPKRIGEQDIRVARGRRHHVVADEDKFALRRVAEHLIRPVAVAVLIDQRVAARIHDHLDSGAELLSAVKRRVAARHFGAAENRVRPHIDRNLGLNRVLSDREIDRGEGGVSFMSSGVRPGETDLAKQNRHHGDRAAGGFAVCLTLRAPALGDKEGLRHRHFAREAPDHIHRDAGDGGRPFRGLRRAVGARAEDIGLVV